MFIDFFIRYEFIDDLQRTPTLSLFEYFALHQQNPNMPTNFVNCLWYYTTFNHIHDLRLMNLKKKTKGFAAWNVNEWMIYFTEDLGFHETAISVEYPS